ncbi:MAG: undecaprenyl-diphosphate phosphatase [Oligoflexia bacterium]
MTLVESIVLALIHGLSRFLPVGAEAHSRILEELLSWPVEDPQWHASFAVGSFAALVLFFIHDWASILSSFLQMLFSRKKPMTFDERFPFFLLLFAAIPAAAFWYLKHQMGMTPEQLFASHSYAHSSQTPLLLAGGMMAGALLLVLSERWSKKTRGLFDLQILDSALFGAFFCLGAVPGLDGTLAMISLALLRNYHLEAATKLVPLFCLPVIGFEAGQALSLVDWRGTNPFGGTTWLQWLIAVGVSCGATFLGLKILTEQIRKRGFGTWIGYRFLIGAVLVGLYFW